MQDPDHYHVYQYTKISEIYEEKRRNENMPVTFKFNQATSRVIALASRLSSPDSLANYQEERKLLFHLKGLRNRNPSLWPKGLDGLLEVLKQGRLSPPLKREIIDTLIDRSDVDKLPEKTRQLFREALTDFLQIKGRDDELVLGREGVKYYFALTALGENKSLDFLRESSKRIIKKTLEHDMNSTDRGMVEGKPIARKELLDEIMKGVLERAEYACLSPQAKEARAIIARDSLYYSIRDFFMEDVETLTLKPVKKGTDIDGTALPLGAKKLLYQALGVPSPLTFFILPCRLGQVLFDVDPIVISHTINHVDMQRGEVYGLPLDRKSTKPEQRVGDIFTMDGTKKLNEKAQELRLACFRMVLGPVRGEVVFRGQVTKIDREILKVHSPYDRPAFDFWVGGNGSEEQLIKSLIETLNILLEVEGIKTTDAICFENGMQGIASKYLGSSFFGKDSWLVEVGEFKKVADRYLSAQKG